ncbi:MAG: homocysteine S-methyltransferase family protein, partial [Alphaproteobacteria bacterium]
FTLATEPEGRARLRRYYRGFLDLAAEAGAGLILEAPTWRASREWGEKLGLDTDRIVEANRSAIGLMAKLRKEFRGARPVVVSGQIGPRGDGYAPDALQTPEEAEAYHAHQVRTLAGTEADLVTALTMTHVGEAAGV